MLGSARLVPLLFALAATPAPTPCGLSPGPAEIALPAGTRLRAAPESAASSVAVLDADVTLPVLSRCAGYAEVRWEGFRGWARPGDDKGPSLERAARDADLARIARVYSAMRPLGREARLGPWRLVTDVAARELTGLDAVAAHLADAYRERYGAAVGPGAGQALAIFASDVRYRVFAEADGSPMLGTRGHAGAGLAAFAMGRNPLETREFLVHELTHLLSRNALAENPPAWLDEGLSEDLAWCRVDAAGRLLPDTLDVLETRRGGTLVTVDRRGSRVTAEAWIERARSGRVPPLAAVLAPDGRLFSNRSDRRDASTQSAMLVRWCLAEPERARRFRQFLRIVSLGGPGDVKSFAAALEMDEEALSREFLKWVQAGSPAK